MSQKHSLYLEVKLKVSKKGYNKSFQLVQNVTMAEANSNQFMRLWGQLVVAAENFSGKQNLTPVLIPTMSKEMDEQLKLAHGVVYILDAADRKICVTLLQ